MSRASPRDDSRPLPTSGLAMAAHAKGSVIEVRAQAGARVTAIRGVHAGALKVSVTQVAEKGKANHQIGELLADALEIPRSRVVLVKGATSARKTFLIVGLTPEAATAQLAQWTNNA